MTKVRTIPMLFQAFRTPCPGGSRRVLGRVFGCSTQIKAANDNEPGRCSSTTRLGTGTAEPPPPSTLRQSSSARIAPWQRWYVIPYVGVRQWVLTLPYALRFRVAYDRTLLTPVLGAFVRSIDRLQRRRARELYGVRYGKYGSATVVQRFGGAVNLNVHFHVLAFDVACSSY